MRTLRPTLIGGTLAALLALGAIAQWSRAVECPAKVVCAREWVLTRGPEGQLAATLTDHRTGRTESSVIHSFERGDDSHFDVATHIAAGVRVCVGDTIGVCWSRQLLGDRTQLADELAVERAALALALRGQKESVVDEARLRLRQARVRADLQSRETGRVHTLASQQLVADADVETADVQQQVAQLDSAIAAAQLATAQSGSVAEELAWRRARVAALEHRLALVEARLTAATVCVPLAGRFDGAGSGDTLAVVRDADQFVAFVLVPREIRALMPSGAAVELHTESGGAAAEARVQSLSGEVYTGLDGRQYLTARCRVASPAYELAHGVTLYASVTCPSVSLLQRLRRWLT